MFKISQHVAVMCKSKVATFLIISGKRSGFGTEKVIHSEKHQRVTVTDVTTTTTPVQWPFVWDYPGEPVPELIWILLEQETVSGSGISWAICKSAPRPRQITTPAPHHSVLYRPDALSATQPTASKHWRQTVPDLNAWQVFLELLDLHQSLQSTDKRTLLIDKSACYCKSIPRYHVAKQYTSHPSMAVHARTQPSSTSRTHTHKAIKRSFVRDSPRELVPKETFTHGVIHAIVWVLWENNRGRRTDNPAGHHIIPTIGVPTSIIPTFLRRMPFQPQPSQFILAWGRHQVCWIAYPVSWFILGAIPSHWYATNSTVSHA